LFASIELTGSIIILAIFFFKQEKVDIAIQAKVIFRISFLYKIAVKQLNLYNG